MKRLALIALTLTCAAPAFAQSHDHHSGHVMPDMQAEDPHAGHQMDGMEDMAEPANDPHAGHDMTAMDQSAGNASPPPVPTDHAADAVFGASEMAISRHHLMMHHGDAKLSKFMIDRAEVQLRDGKDSFAWQCEAWFGGDIDRLWLKSEGEALFDGPVEKAEVQALYSHAIGPYFNLQAGLRHDFRPNPSRSYAVVGVEGMAPYFFELEGALFLSNKGEVMARAEASYDQRITQRLILQPSIEFNFALQDVPEIGVGSGLSDVEIGLRLRYDIAREFSPYIGVQYQRSFGDTRRYVRTAGEDPDSWSLLMGIRIWF